MDLDPDPDSPKSPDPDPANRDPNTGYSSMVYETQVWYRTFRRCLYSSTQEGQILMLWGRAVQWNRYGEGG